MNEEQDNLLLKLDKIRGRISEAERNISRAKQDLYKLIQEINKVKEV